MKFRTALYLLVAIVAVSGVSFAAWRYVHQRTEHSCVACERPIHQNSRTVASVNGKRTAYCCPSCALSEHMQSGAKVEFLSVADYTTGKPLHPGSAYFVRGSDVNSCARHDTAVTMDKHPLQTQYDRCSPSLLAFASDKAAADFVAQHGGQVVGLPALLAEQRR